MVKKNYLYIIATLSHTWPESNWEQEIEKKYFCSECKLYHSSMTKEVFDFYLRYKPDKAALNTLFSRGLYFARLDFLNLFNEDVNKCLLLGKVFDNSGNQLKEFVSYTADHRIPLRGTEKSKLYGICSKCGNYKYVEEHPCYILENSLSNRNIYVPWNISGMIVTEKLANKVERKKFKGIDIVKIPVRREPIDNFELPLTI